MKGDNGGDLGIFIYASGREWDTQEVVTSRKNGLTCECMATWECMATAGVQPRSKHARFNVDLRAETKSAPIVA